MRAVATGKKRAPKKGEWYLWDLRLRSGAEIYAWKAFADLETEYYIAKVIPMQEVWVPVEVQSPEMVGNCRCCGSPNETLSPHGHCQYCRG